MERRSQNFEKLKGRQCVHFSMDVLVALSYLWCRTGKDLKHRGKESSDGIIACDEQDGGINLNRKKSVQKEQIGNKREAIS
jgi:hypothetical protein